MQVVILCGGKGTRIRGFEGILDKDQEDCEHRRFVLSRVTCADCGVRLKDEDAIECLKNSGRIEVLRDIEKNIPIKEIMKKNNILHLEM